MRSVLLSQHADRRREDDVWNIENAQHGIVLISLESEVLVHAISLRISKIALVESIYNSGQQWFRLERMKTH